MVAILQAPCDEQVIVHTIPTRPVPCPRDVGRSVLIATILASSMVFIDSSAVNVALPTLQRELDASAAQAQWVVESYALFLAALLLVGGVLGDRFGRKRIFVLGTVLFAATSVWCGLSPNIEMLIAARAAQGVAAALLTPNDGSRANMMMRIPMVLPATAALPKPVRMRTRPIHDAVAMKF